MSVYKKLSPEDVNITTFRLHKSKQFAYNEFSSSGIEQQYARLRAFNTSSEDTLSAKNIIDLEEKNIRYNQLKHLYYSQDSFGVIDPVYTEKKIFGEANILSIPKNVYGYSIKPGTVSISGSFTSSFDEFTTIIKDDTKGNLYDSSFNTSSFISNTNRVVYLDFKDQIEKIDEFKNNN